MQYADRKLRNTGSTELIDPKLIVSGPKRRDKLPERDILRLSVLHACFLEVLDDKLDDWVDSFCRDLNYEREIRVWERMAACYLRCTSNHCINRASKRRIFGILLGLFGATDDESLRKGFSSLPRDLGRRLHKVVEDWLHEWRATLNFVVEHELSDDEEVGRLIERHKRSAP